MVRAGKARRRVLLAGGYGEEAQHSQRRGNGDRIPAYLWIEALIRARLTNQSFFS